MNSHSLFQAVDALFNNRHPETVSIDFEIGAMNALRHVFNNIRIIGCHFHYGQALHRWIKKNCPNITHYFNTNRADRLSVKCLHSLSFVPLPLVYPYFCKAVGVFPNNAETRSIISYFIETWLGGSEIFNNFYNLDGNAAAVNNHCRQLIQNNGWQNRDALFPIPIWNMCQSVRVRGNRTNNRVFLCISLYLEGFFSVWTHYMRSKPKLSTFLKRVFKEDERWQTVVDDYRINPGDGIRGGITRRKKWIRQDASLLAFLDAFDNTEAMTYLRRVAHKISENLVL